MRKGIRSTVTIGALCALWALLDPRPLSAQSAQQSQDTLPDLASVLDLGRYYVVPVQPKKDPKTGFIIGGKNETSLIRGLKEINGRTIGDLEADMRPGAKTPVGSVSGFLGRDEKLLEVLASDNEYVLSELKSSHQEMAKHLHAMGTIAFWQNDRGTSESEFRYHGRRFKVRLLLTAGAQLSPFHDGTQNGANVTVENLESGKKLGYALLVPYMIDRYGFYEGMGTSYRVDPRRIVEIFDFLKGKGR